MDCSRSILGEKREVKESERERDREEKKRERERECLKQFKQ